MPATSRSTSILGATPILGDIADTVFKANVRNLAIIEKHIGRRQL